jgi:chaperonin GroES
MNQDGLEQEEAPQQDINPEMTLRALVESVNIAENLDEDKLIEIGEECKKGYESDKESRSDWEKSAEEWTKLAKQIREDKTYPWPNASNVKYPLLTTAAMQFAARAYPSLVPSNGQIVKSRVIGKDPTGQKLERANRVSTYMSYQIMHEIPNWEEGMDKLLIQLPVVGVIFKKTYWDSTRKIPVSEVVLPKSLVVNYWAKDLVTAERISEEIEMSPRVLKERQMSGIFLDEELSTPVTPEGKNVPANDETTPYILIEQHTVHCYLPERNWTRCPHYC